MANHEFNTTVISTDKNRENPIKTCMEENVALVEQVRSRNAGSWLKRLLPDSIRSLGDNAQFNELELGFQYRQSALKLAIDSRLQAVQEACNHVLVTGKSEIRRERQEFFADQVSKLAKSMHSYAEEFNTEVDRRLQEISKKYSSEIIRQKEEARLCRQIEGFHQVLEDMASEFQHIINEGVHTDDKTYKEEQDR